MQAKLRPADRSSPLTLTVCVNVREETVTPCCGLHGGPEIAAAVQAGIAARALPVTVQTISCLGLCAKGPNARLAPSNSWFHKIGISDVPELIDTLAALAASTEPKELS